MDTAIAFTAEAILAIPKEYPERLFSAAERIDEEYKALIKRWHPDLNKQKNAERVAAHLNVLFVSAKEKRENDSWHKRGVLEISMPRKKKKIIRYDRRHEFELGEMVYGRAVIGYVVKQDYADLVEGARRAMKKIKYPTPTMQTQLERCVPKVIADFEAADGRQVIVMEKTSDVFSLRDVISVLGDKIDPRHVAWIINRAFNLACLFNYNKLVHCDISADTLFVSPKHHSLLQLGGWWYTTGIGHKMNALPDRTLRFAPPTVIREKKADPIIDTSMIKLLGRELLGDSTGMLLGSNKSIPKPMVDFLRAPARDNPVQEYATWKDSVLPACFGKPRFVDLAIDENAIYQGD